MDTSIVAYPLSRGKQRKRTYLEICKFGTFVPAFYAYRLLTSLTYLFTLPKLYKKE